jgi:transcriptional regulator with XRE-family HTH domain
MPATGKVEAAEVVRLIKNCGPADEPVCQTSEPGERLLAERDLLPVSLDIGRRILDVFGYQEISNIVFRLRSTPGEINAVVNGEMMPSVEILLGIQKLTGASIDWLLTGKGNKFLRDSATTEERYTGRFLPWAAGDALRSPGADIP